MKSFRHLLLSSVLCVICAGCGGSSITFPQGPISGAGNLGMGLPVAAVESQSSFNLAVDFSTELDMLTFSWDVPDDEDCDTFRIIRTPSPPFPNGPVAQVTLTYLVGEVDDLQFTAGTGVTNFVNDTAFSLSALVLCVTDNNAALFPRSDFENVTDLLP